MDDASLLPELSDARFGIEVLRLPADKSEDQLDAELANKAAELGITPPSPPVSSLDRNLSASITDSADSASHHPSSSNSSQGSNSTRLTPHSSIFDPPSPGLDFPSKPPDLAPYTLYLARNIPAPTSPTRPRNNSTSKAESYAQSIFSISSKSLAGIRNRFRLRLRPLRSSDPASSCLSCRNACNIANNLTTLPCGHGCCLECLTTKIKQATTDESKMPPSCCTQPIPASPIQEMLDPITQNAFLNAVIQFSIPIHQRTYCINPLCLQFIPPVTKVDPKAPLVVSCPKCHTRVCSTCKSCPHPIRQTCPQDEPGDSIVNGDRDIRRRCYNCREFVPLLDDCPSVTCFCKAEFCALCGGIWDFDLGCPNRCPEEALANGRHQMNDGLLDDAADAEVDVDEIDEEKERAKQWTAQNPRVQALLREQEEEMQRFLDFTDSARGTMRARHSTLKTALDYTHAQQEEKLLKRHAEMTTKLEDGQIAEELDLRSTLKQTERSIRIRIRHMEAYCEGLGRSTKGSNMPPRVVTEQNLRSLGHQYNLRDDMERQRQAKINMMRDRQAKRMEEMVSRHQEELLKLADKQQADKDELESRSAEEESRMEGVFAARKARLTARWVLAMNLLCAELAKEDGTRYLPLPPPSWDKAMEQQQQQQQQQEKEAEEEVAEAETTASVGKLP